MKHFTKYFLIVAMIFATIFSTTVAYAAPDARRGGNGNGTVTAVDAASMTVEKRNGTEVTVNVTDDTVIKIVATQSEGVLSDVQVGDSVKVNGRRNDAGEIDARRITVSPDGDKKQGRVSAVDGSAISLRKRGGTFTVNTNGDTAIFVNGEATTMDDITEGVKITAYGAMSGEDAMDATLILGKTGRR